MVLHLYIYNGIEYYSDQAVRDAIWENEHKVFGAPPDSPIEAVEWWKQYNVTYIYDPNAEPCTAIERISRLLELYEKYDRHIHAEYVYIYSTSLGFRINANYEWLTRAKINLESNSDSSTITFIDFDRQSRSISVEQFDTIIHEVESYLLEVESLKLQYEQRISQLLSRKQVEEFSINFDTNSNRFPSQSTADSI